MMNDDTPLNGPRLSAGTKWIMGVTASLIILAIGTAWNDRQKLGDRVNRTEQKMAAFEEYPHSAGAFESKISKEITSAIRDELHSRNTEIQAVAAANAAMQRDLTEIRSKLTGLESTMQTALPQVQDNTRRVALLERAFDRIEGTLANETRRGDQRHDMAMSRQSEILAATKAISDAIIEMQKNSIRDGQRLLDVEVRLDDAMKAIETQQPRRR